MAKRKGDQPNAEPQACAGGGPDKIAAPAGPGGSSAEAIVTLDASAAPGGDGPPTAAGVAAEPPNSGPTRPEPALTRLDDVRRGAPEAAPAASPISTWAGTWTRTWTRTWARTRRRMPLAATIALAAAVGAMAGSIATAGLGALWSDGSAPSAGAGPLRNSIARLDAELAALKAAIDTSSKSANAQIVKLGDRFDRLERAQAEPAAKLAKLADAVDRIEHGASAARDTTGSITVASSRPAAQPARPAGPPVLEGWIVRSVYNGAALIQGRFGGVIEVELGDTLPGLGRIENIKRQDGRWVVVTSRGMIVAR